MSETLVEQVLAAGHAVQSQYQWQVNQGIPFSEAQQAEILIAQVAAILAGPHPQSAAAATPPPEPAKVTP